MCFLRVNFDRKFLFFHPNFFVYIVSHFFLWFFCSFTHFLNFEHYCIFMCADAPLFSIFLPYFSLLTALFAWFFAIFCWFYVDSDCFCGLQLAIIAICFMYWAVLCISACNPLISSVVKSIQNPAKHRLFHVKQIFHLSTAPRSIFLSKTVFYREILCKTVNK